MSSSAEMPEKRAKRVNGGWFSRGKIKMYGERSPFEKHQDRTDAAINIGLVIFFAVIASWVIREAYMYWVIQQIGNSFTNATVQLQKKNMERAKAYQEAQQAVVDRMARQQAIAVAEKQRVAERKAERLRQQKAAIAAVEDEKRSKEVAWQ